MKATKNIDIYAINKKPVRVIDVVQFDTGIQLVFNVKDFTIPVDSTATLYVQKPSGKFVYQEENITISDNTITVNLENQALTEYGKVPYQVTISSESDTITTFTGLMIIERSLKDAGAIESKTVQKAFDKLTAEMLEEFQTNAETVVNSEIATIPDDYTELSAKVNESANAIKGKLSGAIVAADDVSPVEHLMNVKVHSKNRFFSNAEMDGTLSGISYSITKDTSTLTLNGTATMENALAFPDSFVLEAGTYTASVIGSNIHASGGNDRVFLRNIETNEVIVNHITATTPRTFTLHKKTPVRTYFVFKENSEYNNQTISIQIEKGESATEYESYIDPSTVKVTRCGKNLIKYPYSEMDKTRAGITYSVMEDGTINYNGTSTGSYLSLATIEDEKVYLHKGVKYTFSGMPSNSNMQTAYAHITEIDGTTRHYIAADNNTFIAATSGFAKVTLVVSDGTVANNQIFKPMLEANGTATGFEPYNGTEYIPTSDGVVEGVTSLSPNMTILTDTGGVVVECEYNKDTNKVIQKIADALGITI